MFNHGLKRVRSSPSTIEREDKRDGYCVRISRNYVARYVHRCCTVSRVSHEGNAVVFDEAALRISRNYGIATVIQRVPSPRRARGGGDSRRGRWQMACNGTSLELLIYAE